MKTHTQKLIVSAMFLSLGMVLPFLTGQRLFILILLFQPMAVCAVATVSSIQEGLYIESRKRQAA